MYKKDEPWPVEVEDKQSQYQGFLHLEQWRLRHPLFQGGWSDWLTREVSLHAPAVGVLLLIPRTREVVLVKQFRVGAFAAGKPPWLLEIVAGLMEPGESAEAVARREVWEETGTVVEHLHPVYSYLPSPGASNAQLQLFYATLNAAPEHVYQGVSTEGEDIEVHTLSWDRAFELLAQGAINNSATLIALQWLQLHQTTLLEQSIKPSDD